MKILGIIPARYGSTRFPGKLLADLGGTSVITRVYKQAIKVKAFDQVIVATDHELIKSHIENENGKAMLTSDQHQSGTDRCVEILNKIQQQYDYVVNVQGDEPFIDPVQIENLIGTFNGETQIATLIKKIDDVDSLLNPNVVKVVKNHHNQALYFSRNPIPYVRSTSKESWLGQHVFYKHLGIYGYRSDVLTAIADLTVSQLEKAESLEQLRWLENDFSITLCETSLESIGIDTPADLEEAKKRLN